MYRPSSLRSSTLLDGILSGALGKCKNFLFTIEDGSGGLRNSANLRQLVRQTGRQQDTNPSHAPEAGRRPTLRQSPSGQGLRRQGSTLDRPDNSKRVCTRLAAPTLVRRVAIATHKCVCRLQNQRLLRPPGERARVFHKRPIDTSPAISRSVHPRTNRGDQDARPTSNKDRQWTSAMRSRGGWRPKRLQQKPRATSGSAPGQYWPAMTSGHSPRMGFFTRQRTRSGRLCRELVLQRGNQARENQPPVVAPQDQFAGSLGMRHKPGHVATFVADAGDV